MACSPALTPTPVPPTPSVDEIPRISVDETYQKLVRVDAVVIDVRIPIEYESSHIKGAISLPEDEIQMHFDELPRDKDLILYCACGGETSSARAAQILLSNGFTRVSVLKGGLLAWLATNYPIEP